MDLLTIRELYKDQEKYLDQEITIGGWVRSIRDSKTFGFIVVNERNIFSAVTGSVQRQAGQLCRDL